MRLIHASSLVIVSQLTDGFQFSELPPRFNSEGYRDKLCPILAIATKYQFNEARATIVTFLEKDWPPTRKGLYGAQFEIMQLQATVDNFANLDHEDDINDPDLRAGPFRQVPANRLSDEDIDRAAMMAITMSYKFDIPSICAAATYRLYVQAKFRTSYRRSGRMAQEAIRGPMTNELAKLASHMPDGTLENSPLEAIASLVSFWVEKKIKRRCPECEKEDDERPEDVEGETEEDGMEEDNHNDETERERKEEQGGRERKGQNAPVASVKKPLPPFVNLRVCEADPLALLRSETLKYYRQYHPDDGNRYCQECYAVLKRELEGWADRLWVNVFTKRELNPVDVLQVSAPVFAFLISHNTIQDSLHSLFYRM